MSGELNLRFELTHLQHSSVQPFRNCQYQASIGDLDTLLTESICCAKADVEFNGGFLVFANVIVPHFPVTPDGQMTGTRIV